MSVTNKPEVCGGLHIRWFLNISTKVCMNESTSAKSSMSSPITTIGKARPFRSAVCVATLWMRLAMLFDRTTEVSDGDEPPLTLELTPTRTAHPHSLDRLVQQFT